MTLNRVFFKPNIWPVINKEAKIFTVSPTRRELSHFSMFLMACFQRSECKGKHWPARAKMQCLPPCCIMFASYLPNTQLSCLEMENLRGNGSRDSQGHSCGASAVPPLPSTVCWIPMEGCHTEEYSCLITAASTQGGSKTYCSLAVFKYLPWKSTKTGHLDDTKPDHHWIIGTGIPSQRSPCSLRTPDLATLPV